MLAVGVRKLRFGWFLATITPGLFSGTAAPLLLIPIIASPLTGGGAPPWPFLATDAFGWLSGIAALVLIKYRFRFLRQPRAAQQRWALLAWAVHVVAFVTFIMLAIQ